MDKNSPSTDVKNSEKNIALPFDYTNDPQRSALLKVNSEKPFNAETPPVALVKHFITPTELFFVRNHGPVPHLDDKNHRFIIAGLVPNSIELSVADLKALFNSVTVAATLMCAGNRRNELKALKPVKGVGWDAGAIGNAHWTGVRLSDILQHAKADVENPNLHVEFIGEEDCEEKTKYGSSIPMSKAADSKGDVILAWAMNGEPLSRDHGFPLRAIVPGYIGARSVKWIRQINILNEESRFCFQRRDYKLFLPDVDWDQVEALWDSAASLTELAVQSVICEPVANQVVSRNTPLVIKGYALSNGRRIWRVDVSVDDGKTWKIADIVHENDRKETGNANRYWSWTLWVLRLNQWPSPCTIVCKAWDVSSNTQPENAQNIWNLRGVMNNAWHRVPILSEPKESLESSTKAHCPFHINRSHFPTIPPITSFPDSVLDEEQW